eukprot:Filipodium_phascolosomae@DN2342_c0_g1_i2.p1
MTSALTDQQPKALPVSSAEPITQTNNDSGLPPTGNGPSDSSISTLPPADVLDPTLRIFFDSNFDAAKFVETATREGEIARVKQEVEQCGERLDSELHAQLVGCHTHLLQNADRIVKLEEDLCRVRLSISSLAKVSSELVVN